MRLRNAGVIGGERVVYFSDRKQNRAQESMYLNLYPMQFFEPPEKVIDYSFLRAVTLSGVCGPLCSSPNTTGQITPAGLIALIFRPLSGREKSNCLMSATKIVCIPRRLLPASS